jgi:hypothetical protein
MDAHVVPGGPPPRTLSRRRAALAAILFSAAAAVVPAAVAAQTAPCRFVLGFAELRAAVGADLVGACLEDEHHNPANGDTLQRTASGLLVWRKSDNFTAFTDGHRTWVRGPFGVQARLNGERFPWERDPPLAGGTIERPAPIEEAQVVPVAGQPGSYALSVVFGLPDGCSRPGRHVVTRHGEQVRVVVNLERPGGDVVCTAIYGRARAVVPLGSGFAPGRPITLDVNGRNLTFTPSG